MRRAIFLLALGLIGCGQSTIEECKTEAAKMPTPAGVYLAAAQCSKKFAKPFSYEEATGAKEFPNPFDQFDAPTAKPAQ